jgi:hypothetical protein
VRAKYVALLVSEKRFVNNMELDGGFRGVDFNGIPLVPDPQCQKNRIYYVVPDVLRSSARRTSTGWTRTVRFSRVWLVTTSTKPSSSTTATSVASSRNALGLLDDISE